MNSFLDEIGKRQDSQGFIKVTDNPVSSLTSDIEGARRIFTTTGYSDGLTRVGAVYEQKNRSLDALKQYVLARNKNKAEPLYERAAAVISALLQNI